MSSALPPETRFSATVDDYARFRPDYPEELFDRLARAAGILPPATVVDVGCGTGKSTRPWYARGYRAIGVEPNADMRARATALGGPTYLDGRADAIPLADGSAHFVCAAQAFHWFALEPTLVEWRRVLRPDGAAAAFWNVRGKTPFMVDYEALLATLGEYHNVPKPRPTLAAINAHASVQVGAEIALPHHQDLDWEGLLGRARSSSYVAHSPADHERFESELTGLFERHAVGDRVRFAYETIALVWRWRKTQAR